MAVVNGLGGSINFSAGTGLTSNVKEWSISFAGAELDTTAMGTTGNWDTYIGGRRSWTGSWTALWDATAEVLTANEAAATGGIADAPASANFFFDGAGTTPGKIVGNIIVTGVDTTVNIDGANEISYTFRGTGSPTWVQQEA